MVPLAPRGVRWLQDLVKSKQIGLLVRYANDAERSYVFPSIRMAHRHLKYGPEVKDAQIYFRGAQ